MVPQKQATQVKNKVSGITLVVIIEFTSQEKRAARQALHSDDDNPLCSNSGDSDDKVVPRKRGNVIDSNSGDNDKWEAKKARKGKARTKSNDSVDKVIP
jgi:hypothetical protein